MSGASVVFAEYPYYRGYFGALCQTPNCGVHNTVFEMYTSGSIEVRCLSCSRPQRVAREVLGEIRARFS